MGRRVRATFDLDSRIGFPVAVGGVVALHILLAVYRIGSRPFWVDEAFTSVTARESLRDVLHLLRTTGASFSSHYLVLYAWQGIFGHSEIALRSLSVVAGVIAVVGTALLGRALARPKTGVIAAFLLGVASPFLAQSQTARSGTLAVAFAVLAMLAFVNAVRTPSTAHLAWWVAANVLLCWAHGFGVFLVITEIGLAMFHRAYRERLLPRRRALLAATAVLTVLLLPLAVFASTAGSAQVNWIEPLGVHSLVSQSTALLGGGVTFAFGGVAVIAGLVLLLRRALPTDSPDGETVLVALAWIVIPIAFTLVISVAKPLLVARYLIFVLPAFALLAAALVQRLRSGVAVAAVTVMIALPGLVNTPHWYEAPPFEDWPDALAAVSHDGERPAAVVAADEPAGYALRYYAAENAPAHVRVDGDARVDVRSPVLWVIGRGSAADPKGDYSVRNGRGAPTKPDRVVRLRGVFAARYWSRDGSTFARSDG